MLDGVSLDQLKAFIAAVDEGSFSGAGRKLLRAQSVISDIDEIEMIFPERCLRIAGKNARATFIGPTRLVASCRSICLGDSSSK